jgi:hypothetical protein
MIRLNSTPPDDIENQWRYKIDKFVKDNQQQLAALAWGLSLEWKDSYKTLGIDLKPQPHFVACAREAIEELNRKVDNQLQEILGVLDGYQPEKEVAIVCIGNGQIKLINFQPNPSPPICFEQIEQDLDELINNLEQRLQQEMRSRS